MDEATKKLQVVCLCTAFGLLAVPAFSATGLEKGSRVFSQIDPELDQAEKLDWTIGRALFRRIWVKAPASTQAADGLGPLYNARSCNACHPNNGRGAAVDLMGGPAESLVLRLGAGVDESDNRKLLNHPDPVYGEQLQTHAIAGLQAEGRLKVDYSPVAVSLSEGEQVTLRKPVYTVTDLGFGELNSNTPVSPRVGPQLIGLGLLERIPQKTLEALADPEDLNRDGISGRVNYVWSRGLKAVLPGRFGHKAGMATVSDQVQAAFSTDLGISTPLFPNAGGDCTSAQKACIQAPSGNSPQYQNLEADQQIVDLVERYTGHLAVPQSKEDLSDNEQKGRKLFDQIGCSSCHITQIALNNEKSNGSKSIYPYTDLLLHDMGEALADFRREGQADGREWRTAPL